VYMYIYNVLRVFHANFGDVLVAFFRLFSREFLIMRPISQAALLYNASVRPTPVYKLSRSL
jgi:hypothetical protein